MFGCSPLGARKDYFGEQSSAGFGVSPKTVLVTALVFIGSVVVMHFVDKLRA
jgi:preprotein translocase subunit Sec61beta